VRSEELGVRSDSPSGPVHPINPIHPINPVCPFNPVCPAFDKINNLKFSRLWIEENF
jgi:hypothetical protein